MRRFLLLTPVAVLLAVVVMVLATEYVVACPSHRSKDVAYVPASAPDFDKERHILDVYSPKEKAPNAAGYPVVLFIHGGSWTSGNKNIYTFIGRRLAKQGVVAVVINYRLAPPVHVPEQVTDCARALAWTVNNIKQYGGDPARLFVMGTRLVVAWRPCSLPTMPCSPPTACPKTRCAGPLWTTRPGSICTITSRK